MAEQEDMRVLTSKQDSINNYNKLSGWYDMLTSSEKPFCDRAIQQLDLRAGETVLELGFGTGHGLEQIARAVGDTGVVHGIDMSPGMHKVTAKRLEKAAISHRVQLHSCDILKIVGDNTTDQPDPEPSEEEPVRFPKGTFDAIFSCFVFDLIDTPELPTLCQNVSDLLKPGGRACIVSLSSEKNCVGKRVYEWFHKVMPKTVDCRPIKLSRLLGATDGLEVKNTVHESMWGIPVETVLATKYTGKTE
eukprot:TRINITY_DN55557_c0_g1_i1.p1 TRINITY_DN55557_c0_g1~~TRINITY_DN55557_c0_g1_i1.p1  ORF type:complete len:247 (-),score=17.78 TRINITY_DN55557_c0_g1_i1:65-805(-)